LALASPAAAQGTLRVAIGTTMNTLDPAKTTIGDEYIYVHLVFNGLTRIDTDLSVKPDLATSWEASADLKTWTFKLRPGVKFHHGRTLDADDVVATFNRILDPALGSRGRTQLSMVSKVAAVDPLTVRFDLNIPYAGFHEIFGERNLRIVPKDRLDKLTTEPVGTGPFTMKTWTPGDRMELVKFPGYFEPGMPKLDGVTLRLIPEAAARITSLESGAIDLLWNLPYEAIDKVKKNPDLAVSSVATATWDAVFLNNSKPPFNDVRVRQAFAAMIDKEALPEIVLFGQGAPTHSPIPPNHAYFNKSIGFPKPDVAKAKKLLAEAGFPNGLDLKMPVPQEREARVRLGVTVRDMVRPAGIRIDVERVPFASYAANVSGKAEIYVDGYFARPTIDTATHAFFHSGGSFNSQLWIYKNARVDELLDLARQTVDEGKRKDIFMEFQKILVETVPGVIAYNALHVNGVRKSVQGFQSSAMQWLELKAVSLK
ncbi:MAG: ABC transporter substrate-binding protein, partial [Alphaproteobacteria bacterium]|nr:ABC transporter substrate-binding protein [Alphaproteobacteria bacterium]